MLGGGGREVGEGQGEMGDPNGGREGWRAQRDVQRDGGRRRTRGGEVGRGGQEVSGGRGEVGAHSGMLGGGGREVGEGQREMGDPNSGREGWRAQRDAQRDGGRRRMRGGGKARGDERSQWWKGGGRRLTGGRQRQSGGRRRPRGGRGMADVWAAERKRRGDGRCVGSGKKAERRWREAYERRTGGARDGEEMAGGGGREVAKVERTWREEAGGRRRTGGGRGGEEMVERDNRRRRTGGRNDGGEEMAGGGRRRCPLPHLYPSCPSPTCGPCASPAITDLMASARGRWHAVARYKEIRQLVGHHAVPFGRHLGLANFWSSTSDMDIKISLRPAIRIRPHHQIVRP
ncbi:hypothetical protein CBR_g37308 [Chara braunii]|uniref:Uncharacterized protein n=1 Tax=Chara braunii TaxID=69332 RepID=A0A388LMP2_CHABU|nr:hypothetical protein CBR_g37308 [Chara braunii]|eukprot:GBG83587.1 hypothetical protein CBR_g37308 [Chara braunii]